MFRKLVALIAFCGTITAPAASAQSLKELNFGIISTESSTNLKQNWQPVIDDMSKRTGMKVIAYFAPDYAGIIEAMRFNKVHVAWFGNKSAMEAVDRAGGEVFAQMIAPDGAPGYWSVLAVHKDSPLKGLEDVIKHGKSLSFGNGDPNSTSGFLVPAYYVFALNKIDPKTHFKTVRSANHEANLMAVANKQVDVATNNTENMARYKARFPEKYQDIRVIWQSPLIPADPLVWRADLPGDVKAKVREFIYAYGQTGPNAAHEREILLKITAAGFKESTNRQLIPIRQLELFKNKVKIENDTAMRAGDKEAKLADINRKLSELNNQLAAAK